VQQLTAAGHQVLGLGRAEGNDIRADLLDRDGLLRAFDGVRADVVVHAATALKRPPTTHKGMYGTDARYTHFLGELDKVTDAEYHLDIVEAWFQLHTPWLCQSGTDIKVGQYVTLEGAEVAFFRILSVRAGHVKEDAGDIHGNTFGVGVTLPIGEAVSARYDYATYPETEGLQRLRRHGVSIFFDPMALRRQD